MTIASLTRWLDRTDVKGRWHDYFPETTEYVRRVNAPARRSPAIPPSPWVRDENRYNSVATAFDYLVGLRYSVTALDSPLDRLRVVMEPDEFEAMAGYAIKVIRRRRKGVVWARHAELVRLLGAMADLDAVYRAGVFPPEWSFALPECDVGSLLESAYPAEFVTEVQALARAASYDLKEFKRGLYNPVFGRSIGRKVLGADGDLIVGSTLIDLKVATKRTRGAFIWQLLAYFALDQLGQQRVASVGVYNPRFRQLWYTPAEELIKNIGGTTVPKFLTWFRRVVSETL